jgi:hypothetical protein
MSTIEKLLQGTQVEWQHSVRNETFGKKTKSRSNCIPSVMHPKNKKDYGIYIFTPFLQFKTRTHS